MSSAVTCKVENSVFSLILSSHVSVPCRIDMKLAQHYPMNFIPCQIVMTRPVEALVF